MIAGEKDGHIPYSSMVDDLRRDLKPRKLETTPLFFCGSSLNNHIIWMNTEFRRMRGGLSGGLMPHVPQLPEIPDFSRSIPSAEDLWMAQKMQSDFLRVSPLVLSTAGVAAGGAGALDLARLGISYYATAFPGENPGVRELSSSLRLAKLGVDVLDYDILGVTTGLYGLGASAIGNSQFDQLSDPVWAQAQIGYSTQGVDLNGAFAAQGVQNIITAYEYDPMKLPTFLKVGLPEDFGGTQVRITETRQTTRQRNLRVNERISPASSARAISFDSNLHHGSHLNLPLGPYEFLRGTSNALRIDRIATFTPISDTFSPRSRFSSNSRPGNTAFGRHLARQSRITSPIVSNTAFGNLLATQYPLTSPILSSSALGNMFAHRLPTLAPPTTLSLPPPTFGFNTYFAPRIIFIPTMPMPRPMPVTNYSIGRR
ncbi:MAG: hypothetical protein V2A71_03910 [Candidatus Eisenbacteria bacterium]